MADDVDIHFDHDALLRLVHSDEMAKELERRGIRVETAAKRIVHVDTGRLRDSITHAMGEDDQGRLVDIGSNVSYAIYQEVDYPYLRPSISAGGDTGTAA